MFHAQVLESAGVPGVRVRATLSRWLAEKHCLVALILNFVVKGFACGAVFFLECNETKAALLPDLVRGVSLSVFVYSEGSAMWPDR